MINKRKREGECVYEELFLKIQRTGIIGEILRKGKFISHLGKKAVMLWEAGGLRYMCLTIQPKPGGSGTKQVLTGAC